MDEIIKYILQLHNLIQNTIGYGKLILLIFIFCILIYLAWYKFVREEYSDEAWKIRKKNGRKSIYWYDEYGNKVYRRPQKSKPPRRSKRGL